MKQNRALITGISGFVGQYLRASLTEKGYEVFGIERDPKPNNLENIFKGDICDREFVQQTIEEIRPKYIYHLAGLSSVSLSYQEPELTKKINVGGTRNLLNAIADYIPKAKTLIVSSAAVYAPVNKGKLTEESKLLAASPYAESRIDQEKLLLEYPNLNIVLSRSFNHTGPGQAPNFVLPEFTKKVVAAEKAQHPKLIEVGNLDVVRDFSDVRDIVNAYILLMEKAPNHEIYNVGSGIGYKLSDLLKQIVDLGKTRMEIKVQPDKFRPSDAPVMIADITKLQQLTNWAPAYSIDKTIKDLLDYWRNFME